MRIRTKLVISYLLLSTMPLIIVGTISYLNASKALVYQAQAQIKNIAEKSVEQIGAFLDVCRNNTKELAGTNISIMAFLMRDFDQDLGPTIERFRAYIKERPYINQIRIVGLDGKEVLTTLKPELDKALDESKNIWFKKASTSEEVFMSDMYISEDLGIPILTMAKSIADAGKIKGVLAVDISGKDITSFADAVKIGKTGYGYIINKSGVIIAHPVKSKIMTEDLSKSESPTLKSVVKEMLEMKTGSGRYIYEGVEKFVFYQPYQPLGWSVGITLSISELMESVYTLIKIMLGVGALVFVIAMLVSLFVVRDLTKVV